MSKIVSQHLYLVLRVFGHKVSENKLFEFILTRYNSVKFERHKNVLRVTEVPRLLVVLWLIFFFNFRLFSNDMPKCFFVQTPFFLFYGRALKNWLLNKFQGPPSSFLGIVVAAVNGFRIILNQVSTEFLSGNNIPRRKNASPGAIFTHSIVYKLVLLHLHNTILCTMC